MTKGKRKYAVVFVPFDINFLGSLQSTGLGRVITLYPTMVAAREEAKRLESLGIATGAHRVILWPDPMFTMVKGE